MLRTKVTGLISLILTIHLVYGDYYSATSQLDSLLEMEGLMVQNLEDYIHAEQQRLFDIRNYIDYVDLEMQKAKNNSIAYFGNPLNAWKVIKRITREWQNYYYADLNNKNLEEYVKNIDTVEKDIGTRKPVIDDLLGAARGIARLQRTYNLETSHLANGTIMDYEVSIEMTASDCYELGMSLLKSNDIKNGASWLLEARGRLAQETQAAAKRGLFDFPFLKDDVILEELVPAVLQNGNSRLAFWLIREQLSKNPQNPKALENFQLAERNLKNERLALGEENVKETEDAPYTITEMYEQTCSGELTQTPREQRELRCRYSHNNVPFCLIAPFKVEELNLDPYVAFYHEAIYESEIENILDAAEDKVERSQVGGDNIGVVSEIRTSKNSWLWHNQNFLAPILQRLTDITGLSLQSAEALQVANYGIGGHYGPHYDFSENVNYDYNGKGNRILTALFYINDVELGGATAFQYLRLAVPPIRRSLVIWYNLHRSLELDYRTKHAGCPVIKGYKWICNEWYHSVGQELIRPCGPKPDGYISTHFKDLGGK